MDNEQARLILSAYRHTGEDASDPFFAEALEQVRVDPELARWFADERQFDQSMTKALRAQEPPEQLRQTLLLGNKVVSLHRRRPLWAQPVSWLSLAAAMALFLGLGILFQQSRQPSLTGSQFAREIIEMAESGKITLGKMGGSTEELNSWLATRGSPHDFTIPASLRGYPGVGCQTFVVNGAKVSLMCFMLGKDQMVHLVVVDEGALKDAPGKIPSIIREHDKVAATWSAGGKTYLLVGMNVSEETLRRLI
jgi:hypothetical protein